MTQDNSRDLLARWRAGDQQAAAELVGRYADRLLALARSQLPSKLARRVDAEDVVQSVYRSLFTGAREGLPDVQRGGDLWGLLVTITLRKIYDQVERNAAGKRAVSRDVSFGTEDSLLRLQPDVLAQYPSPLAAVALADELEKIMRSLDPLERRMFELRLQGFKLEEIAAEVDCSERTVIRALKEIKQRLENWRSNQAGR
jgi:RNA polymerase sigma-70 factor (ECF subfamily)